MRKRVLSYRVSLMILLVAIVLLLVPFYFDYMDLSDDYVSTAHTSSVESNLLEMRDSLKERMNTIDYSDNSSISQIASDRLSELPSKMRELADSENYSLDSGTRFGEPVMGPVNEQTQVFAIRVKSFDLLEDARLFRETLRDNGHDAFISSAKEVLADNILSEVVDHGVFVGPFLKVADTDEVLESINIQFGVESSVVGMSQ
tara:strand:- start:1102 stop:1707 length:606 start_codon:yes stop_codon:yes gene_type:complete